MSKQTDGAVADSAFERRLKTLSIPTQTWGRIFAHDWARALLTLPEDTQILGITQQDYDQKVSMLVRSREFDPVNMTESIPEMLPTIERHEGFDGKDIVAYSIKGWE